MVFVMKCKLTFLARWYIKIHSLLAAKTMYVFAACYSGVVADSLLIHYTL